MTLRSMLTRLRKVVLRRREDRDLEDEIQFHLAQEAQLRRERGESVENARQGAHRAFGSLALTKEATRGVWVPTGMEQLLQDLRLGCRIFTRSPALSATAVLLIALVIGGNTTVFSIAHGILAKPPAGVTSTNLVTLTWIDDKGWIEPFTGYDTYDAFRKHGTVLDDLLAYDMDRATLSHQSGSYATHRAFVSPNYFKTLGVAFEKGRSFTEREADTGTSGLLAVISYQAWQTHFHGDEAIVGKAVMINDQPATVIGVAARPFRGSQIAPAADLWVPLSTRATSRTSSRGPAQGTQLDIPVGLIGRLASGVSQGHAHAELSAIWARHQSANPTLNQKQRLMLVPYSATAGGNSLLSQGGSTFLAIFSVVTLMTLLIVCANVANLLVARAMVRQRELSLRQSLGASRMRIVRALLAEGLALSVAAWVVACLFAWWTSRSVGGFIAPAAQGMASLPDFTPDWTVLGYALLLALGCTVACTVAPALRACRQELVPSLKAGEQAIIRGRSKITRGLVILQLAFSVLLVTSAGLALRSMSLIGGFSPGFETGDLLLVTVNTAASANDPAANGILLDRLSEAVRQVTGVSHVTYARNPPREFWGGAGISVPGFRDPLRLETTRVGPGYLKLFGARPLAGREFSPEERNRSTRSALITRNFAERVWPGESPLGRSLVVDKQDVEIVGVMPNLFFSGFRREHPMFVFLSAQQLPPQPGEMTLYVKYSGHLETIGPAIAKAIQQADATTPVALMRSWDAQLESATWPIRALTMLLMLFAGGSLFIAAIGQYAVVSFDMRRRMRELGLHMALGASSHQVLTRVLREGFALTAAGLLIGFALSVATGSILGRALYGISGTDPLTYGSVFVLLSAASLIACYLPARRAAGINPMTALRIE